MQAAEHHDTMPFEFDRSTYRIPYPPTARAQLIMAGRQYPLIDCSERGIRYEIGTDPEPEPGTRIAGDVRLLSSRQLHAVTGTIVRCRSGEIAVELDAPGIPVQAVFAEQRYLGRHFPLRFDQSSR